MVVMELSPPPRRKMSVAPLDEAEKRRLQEKYGKLDSKELIRPRVANVARILQERVADWDSDHPSRSLGPAIERPCRRSLRNPSEEYVTRREYEERLLHIEQRIGKLQDQIQWMHETILGTQSCCKPSTDKGIDVQGRLSPATSELNGGFADGAARFEVSHLPVNSSPIPAFLSDMNIHQVHAPGAWPAHPPPPMHVDAFNSTQSHGATMTGSSDDPGVGDVTNPAHEHEAPSGLAVGTSDEASNVLGDAEAHTHNASHMEESMADPVGYSADVPESSKLVSQLSGGIVPGNTLQAEGEETDATYAREDRQGAGAASDEQASHVPQESSSPKPVKESASSDLADMPLDTMSIGGLSTEIARPPQPEAEVDCNVGHDSDNAAVGLSTREESATSGKSISHMRSEGEVGGGVYPHSSRPQDERQINHSPSETAGGGGSGTAS